MQTLLWAEIQKLRRSNTIWITIFATVMIAVIIFLGGKDIDYGNHYLDEAGWFMSIAQIWETYFVLPAVIALFGSYMICREEQDDTIKSLRIIPINETKLTAAKMLITFLYSIFLYLLLFAITYATETILHSADLSLKMVLGFLKAYFLDGICVFLAIAPIIALSSHMKKGYLLALVITEIYSFAGLFASMSNVLKAFYPMGAVFTISKYYEPTSNQLILSYVSLLLCGGLTVFLIFVHSHRKREETHPY